MSYDGILAGLNRHTEPELQENAKKCTPQLIQELNQAIAACERSPLLPDEIEELFDVIAEGGSLRFEARKIKDDLPFILRTSSAEGLAELTARLWEVYGRVVTVRVQKGPDDCRCHLSAYLPPGEEARMLGRSQPSPELPSGRLSLRPLSFRAS